MWTLLPVSVLYGWLVLRSGSVWPAAIAHGVHNATCRLMLWFLREPVGMPVDVLVGPLAGGTIGSLGYFLVALPLFVIPAALRPQK